MAALPSAPILEFWFELASTYSYLTAMRISGLADAAGVALRWRPFLLGPIFAAQGWNTSPFNLYPAKGRHMWRDMEREAAVLGIPLRRPDLFPQNSLLAARIAYVGQYEDWGSAFVRAVYGAEFADRRSIAEPDTLRTILDGLGQDSVRVLAAAEADGSKAGFRAQNGQAAEHGIFGAPSFVTSDGELFWGNDRLERALDHARAVARA